LSEGSFEYLFGALDVLTDALCIACHLAIRVLFEFEFKAYVVVRISRCDVPMKMKHRLSRNFTVVTEDIESLELKA
jgi:hypothetical protein